MLNTLSLTLGVFSVLGLINAVAWLGTGNVGMVLVCTAIFGSCGILCIYLDTVREQIEGPRK